jgi:hypothetical protein
MPPAREEILEENRRLRAEYEELFDSVAALLFQHDPSASILKTIQMSRKPRRGYPYFV